MTERTITWQETAEQGKWKLEKAISILNHKMELMLPTPDTMEEYAQLKQAKQAISAALQSLKPIEKYLP